MLKEAEQEFREVDAAKQVDPFAKDKVLKIESAAAAKKSAENLRYGEDLMEALELAEGFKAEIEQFEMEIEEYQKTKGRSQKPQRPTPSIMFNKRTIFEQVHLHLKAIRNPELENTLRFLNYKQSTQLLYYLEHFIRNVRFFLLTFTTEHRPGALSPSRLLHPGDLPAADPNDNRPSAAP